MKYLLPLTELDAQAVVHRLESLICAVAVDQSLGNVSKNDVVWMYGAMKHKVAQLLEGKVVEIEDSELADSRRIMSNNPLALK